MAEFWSEEWFETVNQAAQALPEIDGISFSFDVEVAESVNGKVRAHGAVLNGQIASFVAGKFVPEVKGQKADVSFIGKAKRLLPILEATGLHSLPTCWASLRLMVPMSWSWTIWLTRVTPQHLNSSDQRSQKPLTRSANHRYSLVANAIGGDVTHVIVMSSRLASSWA